MDARSLSRRRFLALGAGAGAALLPGCAGAEERVLPDPLPGAEAFGPKVAVAPLPAKVGADGIERAAREAIEELGGLGWLKAGDKVLLKPASNSGFRYPATTRPELVTAVARILRERGASVVMADQPGVTYVHPRPDGGGKGSTLAIFKENGLYEGAMRGGAEAAGFEAAGYEKYFESGSPDAPHWRGPLMLPNLVREVDHIVYLNRVSAHLLSGATLALKNAVGWIREDSRLELHRDAGSFLEKCAEIAAAPEIRERIRLVMSEAARVQTTIGPDFGHSVALDPGLLVASDNLAMHDVACYGVLRYARERLTPGYARLVDPYPRHSSWMNRFFVGNEWSLEEAMRYTGYVPPARGRALDNGVIRRGVAIFSPQGARPSLAWLGEVPAVLREAVANA